MWNYGVISLSKSHPEISMPDIKGLNILVQ